MSRPGDPRTPSGWWKVERFSLSFLWPARLPAATQTRTAMSGGRYQGYLLDTNIVSILFKRSHPLTYINGRGSG